MCAGVGGVGRINLEAFVVLVLFILLVIILFL
jgi:hypothetical protein